MPDGGDIYRLEKFSSAFYARLEKVQHLIEQEKDAHHKGSLLAEKNMLQQVVEWLNMISKARR